jgi:hypothetical protein
VSDLSLWVANLGVKAWGHEPFFDPAARNGGERATAARVVGQWVALGDLGDPKQLAAAAAAAATPADLPVALKQGAVAPATVRLYAPSMEGDYLLILDIISPDDGSLTAKGVLPTVIRVHVSKSAAADPVSAKRPLTDEPAASADPATDEAVASPDPSAAVTTDPAVSPARTTAKKSTSD